MKKAFYIRTRKPVNEDKGCIGIDKIGGLPTHKPPYFPTYASGKQEGFLMQIYCDKEKFPDFQNILCWQFYQDVNEEDMITIVEVPIGAELNVNNEGTIIERIKERIIYYEEGFRTRYMGNWSRQVFRRRRRLILFFKNWWGSTR